IEWVKEHSDEFGDEKTVGIIKKEFTSLIENRSAAEQWWTQTAGWWPQWESLCKRAGIPISDEALTFLPYQLEFDCLARAASLRKESDAELFCRLLWDEVTKARWHRSAASNVAKLLRQHAAAQFPKYASDFRAVAKSIEFAPRTQQRSVNNVSPK